MKFESLFAAIIVIVGVMAVIVAICGGILFLIQVIIN